MFEQSLLDLAARNGRRPWTVAVSMAIQSGFVGLMILIPLLYTEALPKMAYCILQFEPPPGKPEPPAPRPPSRGTHQSDFVRGKLQTPSQIPDNIYTPAEPEPAILEPGGSGVPGLPEGLGGHYVVGGTGKLMLPSVEPPPPQPKPKQAAAVRQIRVGTMELAMAISRPQPHYPPLAKQARIQGVVRLEAIISKTGTIERLQLLSGHPLLVPSALDAVKQWRYRPTILNGEPVEVVTTIEVHFTLSQ